MLRIPSRLRPATRLHSAIVALAGALVWAFRYDAAVTQRGRLHALVTVGVLLALAWASVGLWHRAEQRQLVQPKA